MNREQKGEDIMKIKRKVEMNLPQLIEWLLKSGYRNYTANSNMGNIVTLSRYGAIQFSLGTFFPEETFTVEVEEEIREDTEFEKLYYTTILSRIVESSCTTIQSSLKHIAVEPIAFYIMNDDLTLTLIWRDGKLVE